jgi:hypothetical protein
MGTNGGQVKSSAQLAEIMGGIVRSDVEMHGGAALIETDKAFVIVLSKSGAWKPAGTQYRTAEGTQGATKRDQVACVGTEFRAVQLDAKYWLEARLTGTPAQVVQPLAAKRVAQDIAL